MKKYISYMITVGGDAGWRFSNGEEWCSCEYLLYFDSSLWTIDSIAKEINRLWNTYWYGHHHHGFTYSETFDIGMEDILPFINYNKGIYMDKNNAFSKIDASRKIDINPEDVERWAKDGCEYNGDYRKKTLEWNEL